jgi:hypothetical protein
VVWFTDRGAPDTQDPPRQAGERGSQTLELAMLVPAVTLLAVLLVHAGILGADVVTAQLLAREAARAAATGGAEAAADALAEAAGSRPAQLELSPSSPAVGEIVAATVRVRSAAFAPFGIEVWLPARAAMRTEHR